jgi:CheY-like chemotaxis protein
LKCVGQLDKADNGKEAFDFVKMKERTHTGPGWYYDLIFLDLDMPIMNG